MHERYMRRCLELAALGAGSVSPNPMVGAVIVFEEQIIGEGYHQKYGEAHAEVIAINQVYDKFEDAKSKLKESVIYVSLEPCAHYGKTPPCALRIIHERIPKIVVGCRDSFDEVNGKGIQLLKDAGVQVTENVLRDACIWLNRRFFTGIKHQRPYVILKWAETPDRHFAPDDGSQFWITDEESRRLVHQWRAEEDCILVGKNTSLADDPKLDVRYGGGRNPKRAVIDRHLTLPKTLHLFNQQEETFVFNQSVTDIDGKIKYIGIEDFDYYLPQYILYQLYLQDISSVIIEGGIKTLQTFIDAGLWDEARIFTGKKSLINGKISPAINGRTIANYPVGNDNLRIIISANAHFAHTF